MRFAEKPEMAARTYRLPETIIDELYFDSAKRCTSINKMLTDILTEYYKPELIEKGVLENDEETIARRVAGIELRGEDETARYNNAD